MHSTHYACGYLQAGVRVLGDSACQFLPLAKRHIRGGDIELYALGPRDD